MDIGAIISVVFTLASLILAFILEGGTLSGLLQPTAAMIVFGGTIGAVAFSFPMSLLKRVPKLFGFVFKNKKQDRQAVMDMILELSSIARRDGLLALDQAIKERDCDEYIKSGLQLVVDGADQEGLEHTLETRIQNIEDRHSKGHAILESAGGYSPTMGVIGTVMGLVNVLGEMSNAEELAHKIAVAFIATLYGVGAANIFWLPMANKLKELTNDEIVTKYMMLEGIMMIQNGSNPALIKEQLKGYLEDAKEEGKEGE